MSRQDVLAMIVSVVALCLGAIAAYIAWRIVQGAQTASPTDDEAKVLNGQCPDCGDIDLHAGPQGGAATNFACFSCLSRFNACFITGIGLLGFERTGKIAEEEKKLFHRQNLLHDVDYVFDA